MKKPHLIIGFILGSIIGVPWFLLALFARIDPPEILQAILTDIIIGGVVAFAIFSLVQLILFSSPKKNKISKIIGIIFWAIVTFTLISLQGLQLKIRHENIQKNINEREINR